MINLNNNSISTLPVNEELTIEKVLNNRTNKDLIMKDLIKISEAEKLNNQLWKEYKEEVYKMFWLGDE